MEPASYEKTCGLSFFSWDIAKKMMADFECKY